jgi:drug/metabolite transporter (DMT)-like permease
LVVLGAALWGTDPLFRQWLALHLPASVIVLVEQLLPAFLVAPFIVSGFRKARQSFSPGDWVSIVILGCGASALATLLFTQAFTYGVPTTPVLLQQIQPLFAVVGARIMLREELQHKFWAYLLGGLAGAYLIAFPHPSSVSVRGWMPGLLAVGAAALWGTGTVLGRRLGAKLPFAELTGLRLFFGLIAASVVVIFEGNGRYLFHFGVGSSAALVALALVPGLFALLVYYRGLRGTPASAATLGELAFPLTALIVDYLAFHSVLTISQWLGVVVLAGTMITMALSRTNGTPTGVEVPELRDAPFLSRASG